MQTESAVTTTATATTTTKATVRAAVSVDENNSNGGGIVGSHSHPSVLTYRSSPGSSVNNSPTSDTMKKTKESDTIKKKESDIIKKNKKNKNKKPQDDKSSPNRRSINNGNHYIPARPHHHRQWHRPPLWQIMCILVAIATAIQWMAIGWLLIKDEFSSSKKSSWEGVNLSVWRPASKSALPPTPKELDIFNPKFMETRLPIVLVGGTDGSGTRAFVDALRKLGVVVVSDDAGTFDVHGQEMFNKAGWPALVNRVLSITHSANYQWEDIPKDVQAILKREVLKFALGISKKYRVEAQRLSLFRTGKRRFPALAKDPPPPTDAKGVILGMKAPISMMVLPVLQQFFGKIKFIHIVRDGRDIALSDNQSPVVKFYNTTYVDYKNRSETYSGELYPVRGMQLWNDWNLQVREWALQQQQQYQEQNNSSNSTYPPSQIYPVEYLSVRSEDLLDPSTKYFLLQQMAEYVGSPLTPEQVCCLAKAQAKDFGKSVLHSEETLKKKTDKKNVAPTLDSLLRGMRPKGFHADSEKKENDNKNDWMDLDEFLGHPNRNNEKTQEREEKVDLGRLQEEEEKLHELEVNLLKRQEELEKLDSSLREREASLQKLMNSIQGLQKSLEKEEKVIKTQGEEPYVKKEDPDMDMNRPQRRRLLDLQQGNSNGGGDIGSPYFVKQFKQWKDQVYVHGEEFQLETIEKLVRFGTELESRWKRNESSLSGVVDRQEILDGIAHLKGLAFKARLKTKAENANANGDKPKQNLKVNQGKGTKVNQRYGKWKAQLENRTKLSNMLHEQGKEALRVFGYEPRVDWNYTVKTSFQCEADVKCSK